MNDEPATAAAVLRPLRALTLGETEGLFRPLGRDPMAKRHLVERGDLRRVLFDEEVWWWALAVFDAHLGPGHRLETRATARPIATLLTKEKAATRLGLSVHAVKDWIKGGKLDVVYFPARSHRLFAAQVAALADRNNVDLAAKWYALRARYALDRTQIGDHHIPPPRVDLPIAPGQPEVQRRMQALRIADEAGWLVYRRPQETVVEDGPGVLSFHIEAALADTVAHARPTVRILPEEAVLPYVLGAADSRGRDAARLIAYREGLA